MRLPGPFWVSFSTRRRRSRYGRPGRRHGWLWWLAIGWLVWPVWMLYRWVYWPLLYMCAAILWVAACAAVLAARSVISGARWAWHPSGTHPKLYPADRTQPMLTIPTTPGDHRSLQNWISMIRRRGGNWPPTTRGR